MDNAHSSQQDEDSLAPTRAEPDREPASEVQSHPKRDHSGSKDLADFAEHLLCRMRHGDRSPVSDLVSEYPDREHEIRGIASALNLLGELAAPSELSLRNVHAPFPKQLGEYQLIREIGRGGMGVVYEARHHALKRRVALKVIHCPPDAGGSRVERFQQEARAAGSLHHSNIVPVFEVGGSGDYFYYAMQFIDGLNLDSVIEEIRRMRSSNEDDHPPTESSSPLSQTIAVRLLSEDSVLSLGDVNGQLRSIPCPSRLSNTAGGADQQVADRFTTRQANSVGFDTVNPARRQGVTESSVSEPATLGGGSVELRKDYFRRVAKIGIDVAGALHHAHQNGVLHRDIKPSNLLFDTNGVTWVTDFGLAKNEEDDLTKTGEIVGTLRYMAPERLNGQADAKSDVYSLGLTLYEMCTLRPAHQNQANAGMLPQLSGKQPPRPRLIDRRILRDMETIVL